MDWHCAISVSRPEKKSNRTPKRVHLYRTIPNFRRSSDNIRRARDGCRSKQSLGRTCTNPWLVLGSGNGSSSSVSYQPIYRLCYTVREFDKKELGCIRSWDEHNCDLISSFLILNIPTLSSLMRLGRFMDNQVKRINHWSRIIPTKEPQKRLQFRYLPHIISWRRGVPIISNEIANDTESQHMN